MPLPHWVARLNKRFTNRFIEPLARHSPHYAVIEHTGRVTGRSYETPLSIFWDGDIGYVALTYGTAADWVRNLQAGEGRCTTRTNRSGRIVDVTVVDRSEPWDLLSPPIRFFLIVLGVKRFLRFRLTL